MRVKHPDHPLSSADATGEEAREHFAHRTFEYTVEQWSGIAKSIQHFQATPDAYERFRLRLERSATSFLSVMTDKTGRKQKRQWPLKHWRKAGQLADDLILELKWLAREERRPPSVKYTTIYEEMDAVLRISLMARKRTMELSGRIADSYPKTTAKAAYHSAVFDVWTELGGELKFSRNPKTKKITGPLARYFAAVTQPVHGGSLESLPDIIKRHEAWKAAREKWRKEMV